MLRTHVRYGLPIEYELPVAIEETFDESLKDGRHSTASERYAEFGYVIARKIIPASLCESVVAGFRKEVKPFSGPLLRQAGARLSPHQFTPDGFVANALLGVHELAEPAFRQFRTNAIEVIAGIETQAVVRGLLADAPLLVESMFFETTLVGTPLHADGDYMDSDIPGAMIGAWFALEDILPLTGRLAVIPKSHKLRRKSDDAGAVYREFRNKHAETSATIDADVKTNLKRRLEEGKLLHRAISESGLQIIAPMLCKGDALFWSSDLIHGSLPPQSPGRSRNSLTSHYVGGSHPFTIHGKAIDFTTETHHGMQLCVTRETKPEKSPG